MSQAHYSRRCLLQPVTSDIFSPRSNNPLIFRAPDLWYFYHIDCQAKRLG